jgi:hypothetical protein
MNVTTSHDYPPDPVLDEPMYLLGEAAMAAGISVGLLKSWISREPKVLPLGRYDRKAHGKGSARVLTLRRVFSIAVIAELVSLGIAPSRAGLLAHTLTDFQLQNFGTGTAIGAADSDAILFAYPDDDAFTLASRGVPIDELLERDGPPFSGPGASCVVLSYRAICNRVRKRLGRS